MKLSTIVKAIWVIFMLLLLFHPVLTIAFIVSNLGLIGGLLLIYFMIRLVIGTTLIDFISKELEKERKEEE